MTKASAIKFVRIHAVLPALSAHAKLVKQPGPIRTRLRERYRARFDALVVIYELMKNLETLNDADLDCLTMMMMKRLMKPVVKIETPPYKMSWPLLGEPGAFDNEPGGYGFTVHE